MIQQFQAKTFDGTPAERRKVMANAAHLPIKLMSNAEDYHERPSNDDQNTFWQFISLLPLDVQTSVIN